MAFRMPTKTMPARAYTRPRTAKALAAFTITTPPASSQTSPSLRKNPVRMRTETMRTIATGNRGSQIATEHEKEFNDWPNSAGFTTFREERTPIELTVKGIIPPYVRGVLYRTGPGGHEVKTNDGETYSVSHWFDAFGQVHRYEIVSPTKVLYNSRHVCDGVIEKIRKTGRLDGSFSFGERRDPCESVFRKFVTTFTERPDRPQRPKRSPSSVNVNVTISPDFPGLNQTASDGSRRNLYTKTDANSLQGLDPETLEPVGVADQSVLHPSLTGQMAASHSRRDPVTGDVFNYNLTFGAKPIYRVFRVSASTGKTDILATITDAPAAYIHSFFLTSRHVILCIYSSHFGIGGLKILYHKNMLEAINPFDDSTSTRWYIIDRTPSNRGVVRTLSGPAFFAFHTINAWELDDSDSPEIEADIVTYPDLDILHKFYLSNLRGDLPSAARWANRGNGHITRYRLAANSIKLVWKQPELYGLELPALNPRFVCKKSRYTYAMLNRGRSTLLDGICKFDNENPTSEHLIWEERAHTPGECIFVPDPQGTKEDDGCVLSVVMDGQKKRSYLLILDAQTMAEVVRAEMPEGKVASFGFHGAWVPGVGEQRAES